MCVTGEVEDEVVTESVNDKEEVGVEDTGAAVLAAW